MVLPAHLARMEAAKSTYRENNRSFAFVPVSIEVSVCIGLTPLSGRLNWNRYSRMKAGCRFGNFFQPLNSRCVRFLEEMTFRSQQQHFDSARQSLKIRVRRYDRFHPSPPFV